MDFKTVGNPIDSAGPIKATLSNLFYGWGYNFYRKENQLRADDLLIRGKISDLLGEIRAHLAGLDAEFRRSHLPPPTREHPFPDAAAVQTAQAMQRIVQAVESWEVKIRNAAVPEMDRIHQRHRDERTTLENLATVDMDIVAAVLALHKEVTRITDAAAATTQAQGLLAGSHIDTIWQHRQEVLSVLF